jgi:TetR/AcrR family transcriptional regulator, repressor of fatR-cypB operon
MDNASSSQEEPLSRREREKAAHRREIMDAAVRVFARRGFTAATLDEIAQEADFSKGALYLYFPSKEDLLYNVLFELGTAVVNGFKTSLSGKKSFREELTDLYLGAADFTFKHKEEVKISMSLHMAITCGFSSEAHMKMYNLHEEIVNVLRERVRKAVADGEVRDVPIEGVAWMIHGSIDSMAMTRWGCDTMRELKKESVTFIDILFRGIEKK